MARNGFHMLLISCKLKKINLGKFLNLLEILKIEPRSSRFSGNTAFANSSKRKQLLPLQAQIQYKQHNIHSFTTD